MARKKRPDIVTCDLCGAECEPGVKEYSATRGMDVWAKVVVSCHHAHVSTPDICLPCAVNAAREFVSFFARKEAHGE